MAVLSAFILLIEEKGLVLANFTKQNFFQKKKRPKSNPILHRAKLIILVKKDNISNDTFWAKQKKQNNKSLHFQHI